MSKTLHVRRDDMVEVTTGDSKVRGRVLSVMPSKNKVVVEGANLHWKHVKPSRQHPRGGRVEREAPIDASNVMLICQNKECKRFDKPVRTRVVPGEEGGKARACTKCAKPISTPE